MSQRNGDHIVPPQLSAFPLFGGENGLPQALPTPPDSTEEDLAAWQPFFVPAGASASPRTITPTLNRALAPSMVFAPVLSPAAAALMSPRSVLPEHMFDTMSMDMGRTTLIPRLNLEALRTMQQVQQLSVMPMVAPQPAPPSMLPPANPQFSVPHTPNTLSSSSHSSRLARLPTTPSDSISSTGRTFSSSTVGSLATGSSVSSNGVSPRGQRVKSTFSAREGPYYQNPATSSDFDGSGNKSATSARSKRRRSIYEDNSEEDMLDNEEMDFVGTYVPTISSARQKKKRALGAVGQ